MLQWSARSPQLWHELVNHEVCVTSRDQQRFEGRVFTVDPVSASVVLLSVQENERPSVRGILGHAVTDVQILRRGTEETERQMKSIFLPDRAQILSAEELKSRRESLRLWLEKNRVPVTEDGEILRVANALTISAPYRPGDCSSANEIILARIQSLVQSTPGAEHTPQSQTHQ
ncbi:gem-associated protein 6 [Sinocyclocheilus grahami]|uniref:Gem-associated protein 6 n=1 Tax=Sinocyclocheilus grahami TaxID=75366 RepID=A0A672NH21_SINGR|nr:PREDICTED: gem-associated protein 6 [Sinocyclocheilus grahami]